MNQFNYFQPTEIRFGAGRLEEIGAVTAGFGKRCLLVTVPDKVLAPLYERVKKILEKSGIATAHFNGVVPNPTTDSITEGANMAKSHKADVIVGLGGGSSMDSAKAIAVEATHEGTCWDYLFYKTPPTEKTLPVVAVTTTSGTGSQVTQVAVITNTEKRDKSAIYNSIVYPRVAIVDPELMVTVPPHVTAATGFDVFCHSFESYIHPAASPYVNMMALESINLVAKYLPVAFKSGSNMEARSAMAWADTLGGLCIANAGVTMPHGMGMAIGGMYPHVAHGEALALVYPAFTRYTCSSAVKQFSTVGRIFDPQLKNVSDQAAAEKSCNAIDNFIKSIGLWSDLGNAKVPKEELSDLAKQCMVLPDYKNNPKVATEAEMEALLKESYRRR